MWNIIIGIAFIIGGLSGHFVLRGTNSSVGLVIFGVILVIAGIFKISKATDDTVEIVKKEEEVKVIDEKMVVYNKSHESLGILKELEIETRIIVDFSSDFGRFYQVKLAEGQTGYILKQSKFKKSWF